MKRIVLLYIALLFPFLMNGQGVVATAKLDTGKVVIGQPFTLELTITQPKSISINWPYISDSIGGLEVVQNGGVDTMPVDDQGILLRSQKVTLMAFDSGSYTVPGFVIDYNFKGEPVKAYTDPLQVSVYLVPVDTTKAIRDIHGVVEMPYDMFFIMLMILLWLVVILIVGAVILYFINAKKKDDLAEGKPIIRKPAYEIAMTAFNELEQKQLWQKNQVKGYYSELTDILRVYIQHRWLLPAMELTSDEILAHGFIQQTDKQLQDELAYVLRLADLVKFAKVIPHNSEHELSFKNAVSFVAMTTPEQEKNPVVDETENKKEVQS